MDRPTPRPDPIRDPTYNLPSAAAYQATATPLEKALSALKVGAILAAVVTIFLIYGGTYAGIRGGRDTVSLLVAGAFVLPSLLTYLLAWRARLRRRRKAGADDPPADPD